MVMTLFETTERPSYSDGCNVQRILHDTTQVLANVTILWSFNFFPVDMEIAECHTTVQCTKKYCMILRKCSQMCSLNIFPVDMELLNVIQQCNNVQRNIA